MGVADPGLFILKSALRAAIVVPLAFALALLAFDDTQVALFASFGSMALLVFVDFGGSKPARLRAYLGLLLVGAVLIVLGTLCSNITWLATLAMGLVAFTILFAGVLDDYIAAARAGVMLTFVLPVMVPAAANEIPMRLAGWGLAGVLCIPAALLLWPGRPRSALFGKAAQAARSLADLTEARSRGDETAAEQAAKTASAVISELRDRFLTMAQRPSGTAGPTAAFARLIDDLSGLRRVADRVPVLGDVGAPCRAERAELVMAAPAVLRGMALQLEGAPAEVVLELEQLSGAHEAFGRAQLAYFEGLQDGHDELEATAEVGDAYRFRQLSFGILQAGRDALEASEDHVVKFSPKALKLRIKTGGRLVQAHASTDSVWLRNSVRGAVGLALAVLVGQLADLQHAFWIVLGTMSVLRSNAISTSTSIIWALLGTLAGIVVGGLIVVAVGADRGVLWAVLPFAVLLAGFAPQAISFAAGQAAFSVVVLVLFNLLEPAGWKVGIVRVEDVAIGAAVSLLVGVLIWPRGATAILRRTIGVAYISAAKYLDQTITALLAEEEAEDRALAAREAFEAGQLLDGAVRDYLANRSFASGRLHDLTVLSTCATRVRRVAALLANPYALVHLKPISDEFPRLAQARDAFNVERHARRDWYESFGAAIAQGARAPRPEHGEADGFEHVADRSVVLERGAGDGGLQPGLAIAWAYRHLESLAELEPTLASAYAQIHARRELR